MVVTAAAVALKVAVVALAGTVIEAGTVRAEVKLLESATMDPFVGAGPESVTVQGVEVEAGTRVVPHCREEMVRGAAGAAMESATALVEEPRAAVTVAL